MDVLYTYLFLGSQKSFLNKLLFAAVNFIFEEQDNINPLQPFPGDVLIEGRHANTIRLGGTKHEENPLVDDSNNGKPYNIIRIGQTDDVEALKIVYDLIEKQNIILGGSSGINIAGTIKLAKKLGKGKTIVTILCDDGRRYASKIFNKKFLKSKNLPIPKWL